MSERLTDEQVRVLRVVATTVNTSTDTKGEFVSALTELLDARQRIADLAAENARLRGELDGIDDYLRFAADMTGVDADDE